MARRSRQAVGGRAEGRLAEQTHSVEDAPTAARHFLSCLAVSSAVAVATACPQQRREDSVCDREQTRHKRDPSKKLILPNVIIMNEQGVWL